MRLIHLREKFVPLCSWAADHLLSVFSFKWAVLKTLVWRKGGGWFSFEFVGWRCAARDAGQVWQIPGWISWRFWTSERLDWMLLARFATHLTEEAFLCVLVCCHFGTPKQAWKISTPWCSKKVRNTLPEGLQNISIPIVVQRPTHKGSAAPLLDETLQRGCIGAREFFPPWIDRVGEDSCLLFESLKTSTAFAKFRYRFPGMKQSRYGVSPRGWCQACLQEPSAPFSLQPTLNVHSFAAFATDIPYAALSHVPSNIHYLGESE